MKKRFNLPVIPGENLIMEKLRVELSEYFSGARNEFCAPIDLRGTAFQTLVWRELLRIPYGETRSYGDVAAALGKQEAVRAVARANAANRLYLLVPCHRVIGHDGKLSGYGGGVARKKRLLELETESLAKTAAH